MTEIVVLSGKGGTGKTTLSAAFAHLARKDGMESVICDLDVDAPDLHILLAPEIGQTTEFRSGHEARIDPERCAGCGDCLTRCRFDAVVETADGFAIDPLACEGCGVCVHFCPMDAIDFPERLNGHWYRSQTRFGPMIHAQLLPGEENSGRLVTLLRQEARALATAENRQLVLSDGAPGIGCPVISSLGNTDLAVLITEPTPSGRHDLARVADLAAHFKVPGAVIVNRADLVPSGTEALRQDCAARGLPLIAEIPDDPAVPEAMMAGRAVTEGANGPLAEAVREAWRALAARAGLTPSP